MFGYPGQVPAVDVRDVSKRFRVSGFRRPVYKTALNDVGLQVPEGELVAILGLNGSGKSTLVRVLATLIFPDRGTARVFGRDVVTEGDRVRRVINRVSVEASFFKQMSAWENLSYAAKLYGHSGKQVRVRALEILKRLGLPQASVDRPMKTLSRGQQQKVAIARSMLTSPNLLLMDEPTTGLDPRSKREVQQFIADLHGETGATVLLCTHDLDEAEQLCQRIVVLDRGQIVADGTSAELQLQSATQNLEQAFLKLTGKSFEEDSEDEEAEEEETKEKEQIS